jgi:phage tail P2-like protein
MSSLLPPNSTPLERAAAAALAQIERVPVPLRQLGNPDTCPAPLLPYLAWAFSVDRWDETWSEATKRAVIRAAFYVHRRKGTISALRRVVEPLGFLLEVNEWWESVPAETPGTFRVVIGVLETGITDEMFQELERLIDDAKPLTRHLVGLAIKLQSGGPLRIGATSYSGDELTVYPYEPGPIEIGGNAHAGFGQHIIDTVSVTHG